MSSASPSIWKFGGASLADADGLRRAATLVAGHRGRLVLVASALAGVTDLLLDGAHRSAAGDEQAGAQVAAALLRRHHDVIDALKLLPPLRRRLLAALDASVREYRDVCRAVAALGELSPRASDLLVSRGERLSSALLAAVVPRTRLVDPLGIVVTDGRHGGASPELDATRLAVRRVLGPLIKRGLTPVVPGFFGAAPDGSVATLGRGGTDLTATLIARSLAAAEVVLWKDVTGILTADPRDVPGARVIPDLHRREAAEAAYFGAKVLHPRALIPLEGTRTTLRVRSFLDPAQPGTSVTARRGDARYPVKALATIRGQALVTVAGKGMMGVPGIAARTFAAVHAAGLSVSTIFQASSESSIGFTLPASEAGPAVAALRRAFKEELSAGLIDDVASRADVAVIAVVGEGMAGTPGIAARVFTALARAGLNVIAVAQGSSERNISFVVRSDQAGEAARRVHDAFQLAKIGGGRSEEAPHTDVVLLGFGRVGRALVSATMEAEGRRDRPVRIVGLLDRSGYVFDPRGLSQRRLRLLAEGKDQGRLLAKLGGVSASAVGALKHIASHAVSRPVLVDVTAEETGDLLRSALGHGFDLVLANKKPLAGAHRDHEALLAAAETSGRRILYEATVGAGLPILDTHRKLVESGDRVLRIEGCLSGTLGFVLSAVSAGRPFSEAVREAMARGYTEPDPRDDLSGRDAARKGLILGRLLGYRGAPPEPENLVPPRLARFPLAEFLDRLPSLDEEWSRRVKREAAGGRVLRYLVVATPRAVRAYLAAVPAGSPAGSLSGTRNLVSFTTRRYREEPLVVTGPGAGAEVTAAGILNDIQQLAAT
ncbi:MAG TPA: aspartate kinase [Vicinamibacteria bacterium]|nr:aspartate kinase [Vicinamibacteria bacterium]